MSTSTIDQTYLRGIQTFQPELSRQFATTMMPLDERNKKVSMVEHERWKYETAAELLLAAGRRRDAERERPRHRKRDMTTIPRLCWQSIGISRTSHLPNACKADIDAQAGLEAEVCPILPLRASSDSCKEPFS